MYQREKTKIQVQEWHRRHRLNGLWYAMMQRCYSKCKAYPNYGGRGIIVCERWRNPENGLHNFINDMGPRPAKGLTVERIDNDGPYSPENCRWATWHEQAQNTRNCHYIQYHGNRMTLIEWSRKVGIGRQTLLARIRLGWSLEDVFSIPICPNRYHKFAR
jgi:hypothetical protein